MDIKTCSAREIHYLNEKKEYTLIASKIVKIILSNPNLNGEHFSLWYWLYDEAKFDKNLAITISHNSLSQSLNKSKRTIERYLKTLQNEGFLKIKENYDSSCGSRCENTIFITIPKSCFETIKAEKDRNIQSNLHKQNDNNVNSPIVNNDETNNDNKYINKNNNNNVTVESDSSKLFYVEHIKAKNVVNFDDNPFLQVEALSKAITNAQCELNYLKKLKCFKSTKDEYEHSCKLSQIETFIEINTEKVEKLKNEFDTHIAKEQLLNSIENTESFFNDQEGDRKLSDFEFRRLKTNLNKLNIPPDRKTQIINEIIYSIRFGDLRFHQGTKQELVNHHAISIALKLIREGRWETPRGLLEGNILAKKACL